VGCSPILVKSAQKLFPIMQNTSVNNYKLTYTKMWRECLQEDLVQATSKRSYFK